MNHQIQDHVDIGAPLAEGTQSMTLDEGGTLNVRPHALHDRVESFAVSDLKQAPTPSCKCH